MALFGAPVAHEDHAVRACYAALDMQAATGATTRRMCAGSTVYKVQIRLGSTRGGRRPGDRRDLRMDYTAVGNHSPRGADGAACRCRHHIATADTLGLAEGYIDVKPTGPVPVKGLEAPVEVYELIGAGPQRSSAHAAAARGLTRFVAPMWSSSSCDRRSPGGGRTRPGCCRVGEPGVASRGWCGR